MKFTPIGSSYGATVSCDVVLVMCYSDIMQLYDTLTNMTRYVAEHCSCGNSRKSAYDWLPLLLIRYYQAADILNLRLHSNLYCEF